MKPEVGSAFTSQAAHSLAEGRAGIPQAAHRPPQAQAAPCAASALAAAGRRLVAGRPFMIRVQKDAV